MTELEEQKPEPDLTDQTPVNTPEELAAEPGAPKKRRRHIWLGSIGALCITAAVVTVVLLTNTPMQQTIEERGVPLSSGARDTDASTSGATSDKDEEEDEDTDSTHSGSGNPSDSNNTGGSDNSQGTPGATGNAGGTTGGSTGTSGPGNSTGGGSTGGNGGGSNLTWYPPYDEQVWVDTSSWQSVYVRDNPVFQEAQVCNTCGEYFFGGIWDHINAAHGEIGGFHSGMIQVGTEPIYEQQWIASGYWETIHHEGYWG